MKIKPLIEILAVVVAVHGNVMPANADTFVGPTTSTNRFIVGANNAVFIDTLLGNSGGAAADSLVISNITYPSPIASSGFNFFSPIYNPSFAPVVIAGPAELIVGNPCVIHYATLTNSSMQRIMWATTNATDVITIPVPAGQTIQFFLGGPGHGYQVPATFSFGSQNFPISLLNGAQIQGPATLSFDPNNAAYGSGLTTPVVVGSYWFVQKVFQNPNTVLVSGAPNVLVQKSADLTTWQTVGVFPMTVGSNSFYRLEVSQ